MTRRLSPLTALLFALLSALLAALGLALPLPAAAALADIERDTQHRLDSLVQQGWDEPDAALATLAQQPAPPSAQRHLALARGLVLAGVGRRAPAEAAAQQLDRLAADPANPEPLAAADAALVRATLSDNDGASAAAVQAGQAARLAYERLCPAAAGCDYRSQWRAHALLARHLSRIGQGSMARDLAVAGAEVARLAGDTSRQALALVQASDLSAALGDTAAEQRLAGQAQRLARMDGSPLLLSRIKTLETRQLSRRGDPEGARRAAEAGLALARQAGSPRQGAVHLTNMADIAVKNGRPQEALHAVQLALPVLQRLGSVRAQRTLMHNAALARLALGQPQVARRTLDELLAAHHADGALADEAEALHEFSDAFAKAGDLRTALDLYHQERKLAAEIMAANRDAALAELRARFDKEAQQRQLEQLGRESSLMSAQLDNRAMLQKLWAAVALVLLLAGVLVALLYKRVHDINRRLAHNHAFLRAQSQRDPLTGLANRRGLHEVAQHDAVQEAFSGALLLVDIDHFKHVNDGHGHAAGDAVLVDVARRLASVVRDNDLVARWGGEEFLIYMPGVAAPAAQALAERVLQAVGGEPVMLPAQAGAPAQGLRVTVSVGYGCFPLPPARLPLTLERAINLVDMALYTAKGQGRNRAVGVTAARADRDDALLRIESDFEQAWNDGRITLLRTPGPAVKPAVAPTEPAALS
jgi:diguanylate cyclase (GGDEF)-like protein